MNNSRKPSRRKFTAEFKAKVALEAMPERQTLSDLCKKYELHPNQITQWKKHLKEQSASVFKEQSNGKDEKDKLIEQLYKTIGELTMDVDFLKKSCFHECTRAAKYGFV